MQLLGREQEAGARAACRQEGLREMADIYIKKNL